jgi:hypothetical protein
LLSEWNTDGAEELVEDKTMALSMTTDFSIPMSAPVASLASVRSNRRRHITPQAGHALEILGHAIEYLTDEFVHQRGEISAHNGTLEAVQLLMSLNRQVYFDCPVAPTISERLRSVFHLRDAA